MYVCSNIGYKRLQCLIVLLERLLPQILSARDFFLNCRHFLLPSKNVKAMQATNSNMKNIKWKNATFEHDKMVQSYLWFHFSLIRTKIYRPICNLVLEKMDHWSSHKMIWKMGALFSVLCFVSSSKMNSDFTEIFQSTQ